MLPRILVAVSVLALPNPITGDDRVLDAIVERQGVLQNVSAAYERHDTFSPLRIENGRAVRVDNASRSQDRMSPRRRDRREPTEKSRPITAPRSWECVFRYLDGKAYYEKRRAESEEETTEPAHDYVLHSYAGDRSESASRQTNEAVEGGRFGRIIRFRPTPLSTRRWGCARTARASGLNRGSGGPVRSTAPRTEWFS